MPQAMLFTGAGQPFQKIAQADKPLRDSELRVRILCCTLCRSDLATYSGQRIEPMPTILGHEVVGAIEAFGPNTSHVDAAGKTAAVGDRITWAVMASCYECFYCQNDLSQKCECGIKYGHHQTNPIQPDGGGLADMITLVPGTAWFRVPDPLSTPVASLANCAGATIAAVLEAAGSLVGRSVFITGAGLLGVLACAMTSAAGATCIIALDPDSTCRERSIKFGATHALDPRDPLFDPQLATILGPRGADVTLELAGRIETVELCLKHVRIGGVVVLAGTVSPTPMVSLDPQQIVRRMLTIRGMHNYQAKHLQMALEFLADHEQCFPFASLIADTFPLDQSEAAFAAARSNPGRRIAVVPKG